MTVTETAKIGEAPAPASAAHDNWPGLLRAEWTKIRSVRSTVWSLIAFVVVAIGFSLITALVLNHDWNTTGGNGTHAQLHNDPTATIYGAGFFLGQLALCVLGVIVMTSEYTTGAIRSSLLAVPRRLPMLAAKAIVFGLIELVASAITVFVVFFMFTSIIHDRITITLGTPGVLRGTIGGILYLVVLGLIAMAIGGLIRHTAGAIAAAIGVVFVLPLVLPAIPGTIAHHINAYLPAQAGALAAQTSQQSGDVLSPWQGFGVLCVWAVVLLAGAAVMLSRRDA